MLLNLLNHETVLLIRFYKGCLYNGDKFLLKNAVLSMYQVSKYQRDRNFDTQMKMLERKTW